MKEQKSEQNWEMKEQKTNNKMAHLYPNISISIFNEIISRHQLKIGGVD